MVHAVPWDRVLSSLLCAALLTTTSAEAEPVGRIPSNLDLSAAERVFRAEPSIRSPSRQIGRVPRGQSRAQTSTDLETEAPAFFKTRTGIVTLIAMGSGVGFGLYSAYHDRVKSPGR